MSQLCQNKDVKYLALILLVFSIFCIPILFAGKSLYPVAPGRSNLNFNEQVGVKNGIMNPRYLDNGATDWIEVPINAAAHDALRRGEPPLWSPYNALGMPILANTNGATLAPLGLGLNIDNSEVSWNIMYVGRLLFAVIFTFYFLRRLRLGPVESLSGALLFGFSGYAQLHLNMFHFHVDAMMPFLFWATLRYAQDGTRSSWILMVVAVIGMILGGNPQNLILGCTVAAGFFLHTTWTQQERRLQSWLMYGLAFAFAIGCCAFYGMSFLEMFQRALKYHDGMGLSSLGWSGVLGLFFPVFFASPGSGVHYMPYIGLLTLPVIAGGLRLSGTDVRPARFFLLAALIIILKIAGFVGVNWIGGLPVLHNILFIKYVSVFYFAVAVLFAFAIRELWMEALWNRRFFSALFLAVCGVWTLRQELSANPYDYEFVIKWLFVLLFCATAIGFATYRFNRLSRLPLLAVLLAILCELLLVRLYQQNKMIDAGVAFDPPKFVQFLKADRQNDFDRIFGIGNILMGNMSASYQLHDIRALSATLDQRYYDFMRTLVLGGKLDLHNYTTTSSEYHAAAKPILDLLGVKYVVFDDCKSHELTDSTVVYTQMCMQIHKNNAAFERAFVVHSFRNFQEDSHVLRAMQTERIDYARTALLVNTDLRGVMPMAGTAGGSELANEAVSITYYGSDKVRAKVSMKAAGVLVLSDMAFPGWKVNVNGQEQTMLAVDYILRGVVLSPGEHLVEFVYRPDFAYRGIYISLAFVFLTGLFAFLVIRRKVDKPTTLPC
jgi:hypothetical protein